MPVDAPPRRLSRRCSLIEKEIRNDIAPPSGDLTVFPRPLPAGKSGLRQFEDEARKLGEEVRDPVRRLVHEWFWFWPLSGHGESLKDPALASFADDPRGDTAFRIWYEVVEKRGTAAGIAAHNLAVYFHFAALAAGHDALDANQSPTSEQSSNLLVSLHKGWSWWRTLLDPDYGLWSDCIARLGERIESLNDPSLKDFGPSQLKEMLPGALASIQARLALALFERCLPELARAVMDNLREEIPLRDLEEVLRPLATDPRKQIDLGSESAIGESKANPDKGLASGAAYLSRMVPQVDRLALLFPEGHQAADAACDKVATTGLQCQIAYANATKDWAGSIKLLKMFTGFARTDAVIKRMSENLLIAEENHRLATINDLCWSCGVHPKSEALAVEVVMHGDVNRTFQGITWNQGTIKVPRCEHCAKAQQKATGAAISIFLLVLFCGLGLGVFFSWNGGVWSWPAMAGATVADIILAAAIATFAEAQMLAPYLKKLRIKELRNQNDYPVIQELLKKGWNFGNKPPHVQ